MSVFPSFVHEPARCTARTAGASLFATPAASADCQKRLYGPSRVLVNAILSPATAHTGQRLSAPAARRVRVPRESSHSQMVSFAPRMVVAKRRSSGDSATSAKARGVSMSGSVRPSRSIQTTRRSGPLSRPGAYRSEPSRDMLNSAESLTWDIETPSTTWTGAPVTRSELESNGTARSEPPRA